MRVTASKIGLLAHCQHWARLDATHDPRRESEYAARGTRFHANIAAWINDGAENPSAERTDDDRALFDAAREWLERSELHRPRAEVAFAWDHVSDASELLEAVNRDYSTANGRLAGTADLVTVDHETRMGYVGDWKTGDGSSSGPQLRTLALMVARAYGLQQVRVEALEVRASGVTPVACETLDEFALAAHAGELADLIASIDGAEPQPGAHCGELYCPAMLSCPAAHHALAEVGQIIPAGSLVRRPEWRITDPVDSPERAIWALAVLRLMSAYIDAKKDDIKALVPPQGWATADGRVLRETTATIQVFDKSKAQALLRQLGATDQQIASCFYPLEKSNGLRVSGGTRPKRARKAKELTT